jgi:hypothetical protein
LKLTFFTTCMLVLILVIFSTGTLYSQEKSLPLSDARVTERLAYLENALYSAQPAAQAWWFTWMSLYAGATAVQGSLALLHWNDWKHDHHPLYTRKIRNRGFAESMLVGAVTTALGTGGQWVFPFKPAYLPDRLRRMSANTADERRAKLQAAEDIMQQCYETEMRGRGWLTHVLNFSVNIGAALTTVFAFKKPWNNGLITLGQGVAGSLLTIYTQPRHAVRDYREYNARYRGGRNAGGDPYENEIFVTLCPGGLAIGIKF